MGRGLGCCKPPQCPPVTLCCDSTPAQTCLLRLRSRALANEDLCSQKQAACMGCLHERETHNAKGHSNVFTFRCVHVGQRYSVWVSPSTLFETESVRYLLLTHKIPAIFLSLPPSSLKEHCAHRYALLRGSGPLLAQQLPYPLSHLLSPQTML